VAIPAYGNYTARAQVSEAFVLLDGLKAPMSDLFTTSGLFEIGGSGITAITTGKYVDAITVGDAPAGGGGGTTNRFSITAQFKSTGVNSKLVNGGVGLKLHFYYNPISGSWSCGNGDDSNDDQTTIAGVDSTTPIPASATVANVGAVATQLPPSVIPKSCFF
jgi:type IV pilus assembly protein PilA